MEKTNLDDIYRDEDADGADSSKNAENEDNLANTVTNEYIPHPLPVVETDDDESAVSADTRNNLKDDKTSRSDAVASDAGGGEFKFNDDAQTVPQQVSDPSQQPTDPSEATAYKEIENNDNTPDAHNSEPSDPALEDSVTSDADPAAAQAAQETTISNECDSPPDATQTNSEVILDPDATQNVADSSDPSDPSEDASEASDASKQSNTPNADAPEVSEAPLDAVEEDVIRQRPQHAPQESEEILTFSPQASQVLPASAGVTALTGALNDAKNSIDELERLVASKTDETVALQGELHSLQNELEQAQEKLQETNDTNEDMKNELEESKNELESVRNKLAQVTAELQQTKASQAEGTFDSDTELKRVQAELQEVQGQLEETRDANEVMKNELDGSKERLQLALQQLGAKKKELEQMEEVKCSRDELSQQLHASRDALQSLRLELEQTQAELQQVREARDEDALQSEATNLNGEITRLQQELELLRTKAQEWDEEKINFEANFTQMQHEYDEFKDAAFAENERLESELKKYQMNSSLYVKRRDGRARRNRAETVAAIPNVLHGNLNNLSNLNNFDLNNVENESNNSAGRPKRDGGRQRSATVANGVKAGKASKYAVHAAANAKYANIGGQNGNFAFNNAGGPQDASKSELVARGKAESRETDVPNFSFNDNDQDALGPQESKKLIKSNGESADAPEDEPQESLQLEPIPSAALEVGNKLKQAGKEVFPRMREVLTQYLQRTARGNETFVDKVACGVCVGLVENTLRQVESNQDAYQAFAMQANGSGDEQEFMMAVWQDVTSQVKKTYLSGVKGPDFELTDFADEDLQNVILPFLVRCGDLAVMMKELRGGKQVKLVRIANVGFDQERMQRDDRSNEKCQNVLYCTWPGLQMASDDRFVSTTMVVTGEAV